MPAESIKSKPIQIMMTVEPAPGATLEETVGEIYAVMDMVPFCFVTKWAVQVMEEVPWYEH